MSEFFAMGGYAAYIWTAYGITTIVLCGLLWFSLKSMREREALVASLRGHRGRRGGTNAETKEPVS